MNNPNRNEVSADPNRRKWFSQLLTSIGAITLLNAGATNNAVGEQVRVDSKKKMMIRRNLELHSPKDGFVSEINVRTRNVAVGDLICSIDSAAEERTLEKTQLAGQLLDLEGNWLEPSQIKLRRRPIEIAIEIASKYIEFAESQVKLRQHVSEEVHDLNSLGSLPFNDVLSANAETKRAEAALFKAKSEKEKAELSLSAFDFNVAQMRKRLELVRAQIPKETEFVNSRIQRLQIYSPVSGEITMVVAKGSFVARGMKIGQIEDVG